MREIVSLFHFSRRKFQNSVKYTYIYYFFINTSCGISKPSSVLASIKYQKGQKNKQKKQSDRIFLNRPDQKTNQVNRCSVDKLLYWKYDGQLCVILRSQKPEFPARVFLGLRFGLAFGRGADGLLRIRQRGEQGLVRGTQSRHQRLELIFLQFKVQLHAAAQRRNKDRFRTVILYMNTTEREREVFSQFSAHFTSVWHF